MHLLLLKKLASKNGVIVFLIIGLVLVLSDAYRQRQEVKKIQAVYQNPQIKTIEKIIKVAGPIRIVTRIIERPGVKETTVSEIHEPIIETIEASHETKPTPVNQVMTPYRTDRYLLTVGINRLTPNIDGKALFIGYGFKNRLDIQVGGVEHDGFSPWLLTTVRF